MDYWMTDADAALTKQAESAASNQKAFPAIDLSDYDKLYESVDAGHAFDTHIAAVRNTAKVLAAKHDPENVDLADMAARLHDVGRSKGDDRHEIHGHDMLSADPRFSVLPPAKFKLLLEAVRQHRGSTGKPRSTFAKIIADADKTSQDTAATALNRSVMYYKAREPKLSRDELVRRALTYFKGGSVRSTRGYFPETREAYGRIYNPIKELAANSNISGASKLLSSLGNK